MEGLKILSKWPQDVDGRVGWLKMDHLGSFTFFQLIFWKGMGITKPSWEKLYRLSDFDMEGFKFGGSDHKMEMVVGSVKMDGLGWGEMEPAEGNAAGWEWEPPL